MGDGSSFFLDLMGVYDIRQDLHLVATRYHSRYRWKVGRQHAYVTTWPRPTHALPIRGTLHKGQLVSCVTQPVQV